MVKKDQIKLWGTIIKNTFQNWLAHEPFQMSAAVSYYALFSFPALIIIVIQTAGTFYDKTIVRNKIIQEIKTILGSESAQTVETLIKNAMLENQLNLALLVGIGTLLYGSTGMFISLQKALNTIWEVQQKTTNGYFKIIRDRLFSLGLIIVIGFLLLISLITTALINAVAHWLISNVSDWFIFLIHVGNFILSLSFTTVLFALIFKILPDVKISWKSVLLGGLITSIFFTIGKSALGIYFSTMTPETSFGAAGSIILILLWVSYSCLILFLGAEFTREYANTFEKGLRPTSYSKVNSSNF